MYVLAVGEKTGVGNRKPMQEMVSREDTNLVTALGHQERESPSD